MNRCASFRVWLLQLAFVLVAVFPVSGLAQEYTKLIGEAPERKADPAPTTIAPAEAAKGFEEILFIVHKAAGLIARPGLELAWEKLHLLGPGGGDPGGFKGNIGGSGPKSGTGITLGYSYYNNPFWTGVDAAVTYKGYTNDYTWIGVTDPKYNNFLRARFDYDLDRHDEFTGLGMDTELDREDGGSPEEAQTDYYQEEIRVMGEGQVRLGTGPAFLGARGGYRKNNILKGKNDDIPDITKVFGGVSIPGVGVLPGVSGEDADYTQVGGYLLVDTRDVPGSPARGVLFGGGYDTFRGTSDTPFDYDRWTGEFAGYLPLPDAGRVIAVRVFGVHQDPKNGETVVPYYALSSIGGPKALRSYDSQRFQDNDQLYTGLEYRRRVWSDAENRFGLDAALVVESAAVYRDMFEDFDLGDMKQSFGTEVRLLTPNNNDLRMGCSFGDEGGKFFISGGGRF